MTEVHICDNCGECGKISNKEILEAHEKLEDFLEDTFPGREPLQHSLLFTELVEVLRKKPIKFRAGILKMMSQTLLE